MTAPVVYVVAPLLLLAACTWLIALLTSEQRDARTRARRAERLARPGTPREDALALQLADANEHIRRLTAELNAQRAA